MRIWTCARVVGLEPSSLRTRLEEELRPGVKSVCGAVESGESLTPRRDYLRERWRRLDADRQRGSASTVLPCQREARAESD